MILRNNPIFKVALEAAEKGFGSNYDYMFCNFKHGAGWAQAIMEKNFESGNDLICVETPLIGRSIFEKKNDNSKDDSIYYRVSKNYVATFEYKNYNIDPAKNYGRERLESILEKTGTVLKPQRPSGDHIVYAMQVPTDTSLRGLDVFAAAQYDLITLRQYTGRKIYVSLHPDIRVGPTKKEWAYKCFEQSMQNWGMFERTMKLVGAEMCTESTHKYFDDCHAVVCYTSGVGFEALAEGVPVITLSPNSFVRPITNHSLCDIEDLNFYDREDWLSKIAYCQWNVNEIESGLCRKHLLNAN